MNIDIKETSDESTDGDITLKHIEKKFDIGVGMSIPFPSILEKINEAKSR